MGSWEFEMLVRRLLVPALFLSSLAVASAQPPTAPPAAPAAAPAWPSVIAGKDLATWIKDLRESPDGFVRESAVKAIPNFGPAARGPALKPLTLQLSRETDPGVRINIILALGMIGAEKPEDAKPIVEALNGILLKAGPSSPVRLHGTRALANYGTSAASVIPLLLTFDEDAAWETRQAVAYTLGRISRGDAKRGPSTKVLDSLIKRLAKDESATVRMEIAQSLLLLGPPLYNAAIPNDYVRVIKPYLDAVVKKLETETDGATRVWLLMTQMTYDGQAFTDANIAKIADTIAKPEPGGRVAALRALGLLGQRAKVAVPAMIGTLRQDDPALKVEGMIALATLKTLAKDALPDLEAIKNGKDEYLKQVATEAHDLISGKKVPPGAPPVPAPKP